MLVLYLNFPLADDLYPVLDLEYLLAEIVQEPSSFGIASMELFCRRILITRVMSMLLLLPQVITECFLLAPTDR